MSHIEKKEFEIYRITPPPPEWDLQEYIRQYVQSGDDKYFYWFLHYYEPTLNEKAKSFRNKYSIAKGYNGWFGLNAHPNPTTGFDANTSDSTGFTSQVKNRKGEFLDNGKYVSMGFCGCNYDMIGARIDTPGWVWMEYSNKDGYDFKP